MQFRGDVEGTNVIDAEMIANELARKTFQVEIFFFGGFVLLGRE